MYSFLGSSVKERQAASQIVSQYNQLKRRNEVIRRSTGNEMDGNGEHSEGQPLLKKQRQAPIDNESKVSPERRTSPLFNEGNTGYPFLSYGHQRLSHVSQCMHQQNRQQFISELANKIYRESLLQMPGSVSLHVEGRGFPVSRLFASGTHAQHLVGSNVAALVNINRIQQPIQLSNTREEEMSPARDARTNLSALAQRGTHLSLAADEDHNWLSELQCFVRSELVEVFKASWQDVEDRKASKNVNFLQVGIRCKFCAHLPFADRAQRSSSFPSTIPQIYQSFTMMVREHFGKCSAVPPPMKSKFFDLKKTTTQGDSQCKDYWVYSAEKVGLADSENGLMLNDRTRAAGLLMPPFGTTPGRTKSTRDSPPVLLVSLNDRGLVSEFIYNLMLQCQKIELLPSEQTGSRKMLEVGTTGFGCRYCCAEGRLGLSRTFPAKRNKLPGLVRGFSDHIRRCTKCPMKTKLFLAQLQEEDQVSTKDAAMNEKKFFDRIWAKLGKNP